MLLTSLNLLTIGSLSNSYITLYQFASSIILMRLTMLWPYGHLGAKYLWPIAIKAFLDALYEYGIWKKRREKNRQQY